MKNLLSIITFCFLTSIVFGQEHLNKTTRIYGVVIDSESYLPIKDVKISYNNKVLTSTNKDGFFESDINFNSSSRDGLKVTFSKSGFNNINSIEKWEPSMYKNGVNYLVGLKSGNNKGFTDVSPGDLSYDQTIDKLEDIKKKKHFKDRLAQIRLNNENSFFEIDEHYYILSNTHWLEVGSPEDSIRLNDSKPILAKELNSVIKRSQIVAMTPDEFEVGVYRLTTKKQ